MSLQKAQIGVYHMGRQTPEWYDVQFNPESLRLEKSSKIAEIAIPGLDTPLHHYVRGETEKLTVALFFDTSDGGMDDHAVSVTKYSDRIYQLLKIQSDRHAPPLCEFKWGASFPGDAVGDPPTTDSSEESGGTAALIASGIALAGAITAQIAGGPGGGGALAAGVGGALIAGGAAGLVVGALTEGATSRAAATAAVANQRRHSFKGLAQSVTQEFILFSSRGVPLRAKVTLVLSEYRSLDEQLGVTNRNSPDKTQMRILQEGQTLSAMAAEHYGDAARWRLIAQENGIDDPRRLTPGTFLKLPPLGAR